MALNHTFVNTPVISKVKIGNTAYYVKDKELRELVNAFGNATAQDVATGIVENGTGLTTSKQVYDFVLEKTADLAGAMHFIGVTSTVPTAVGGPTVSGHTGDYEAGDVVLYGVIEYVYDGEDWHELGDETRFVPKSRTIAGLDLEDNVSADEVKQALSLKLMAYVDTASTTLNDYATGINSVDYTPAGSVTATVSTSAVAATLAKTDYTPAGSVTGTVTPSGNIGFSADDSGFQISGTNAASNVSITPTTQSVLKAIDSAAVAPSFTEGAFTPGSFTKGTAVEAATEGIVASIGTGEDAETLIFTAAAKDNVMDYDATYVAPSKAADTFSAGSAATFTTETVWTGVSAATAAAQTFTGNKIAATFTGDVNNIAAIFAGTTAANALVTGVTYDKTNVSDFAFSGTEATIAPTLITGNKTVQVSPDTVSSGS